MPVISINSSADFDSLKSKPGLLIVDFFATWCGPCKAISPTFDRLSDHPDYSSATFARLDVDKVKPVAQACSITAMPTFLFFLQGIKKDELKGADPHALQNKIKKYIAETNASQGNQSLVRGMISLNTKLDFKQVELLNATESASARGLLDPTSKHAVNSDSDEQLMLYVPFQESVKAHSIVLRCQADSLNSAPSRLQIFANRPNILSFDDVNSIAPTQTIDEITYDTNGVALVTLRFVKFQKVNNLVLFIEQNHGEQEVTSLFSIEFLGEVSPTNSSGVVQKIDHDHD
ncbi:Thioredoxin-like I protein Txl1 [Taphrina deformans PYCC 5710]|uniref:Thioredoxin-like I protein Txl1 n=1 Tax=Taphrina deformans (strain PYCC 5710 / ATCC 11124 / CBS 356.35 / IMI 108563 / JCM 9778 / NBRC 8474) TaxID=1097556 RepID=R4XG78_TAPDE|nr:Thioredoxin-like I protein Txl1 [Taphrina deformans PYCC 5710]|eukprot:CCG83499.1 Thioredoxin-like I protein Txl1 [Taphrina deformans PYCC 5710]